MIDRSGKSATRQQMLIVNDLARLSQLEGVTIHKPLQISATIQKVCTKVIPAIIVLSV